MTILRKLFLCSFQGVFFNSLVLDMQTFAVSFKEHNWLGTKKRFYFHLQWEIGHKIRCATEYISSAFHRGYSFFFTS